jgi:ABC-2 type transport system permease protein
MPYRLERAAIAAFVVLGWRQASAERLALVGRATLYVLVLAIFWQLWRATPLHELAQPAPAAEDLLWYLVVTEWIVFAGGLPYREVESDIIGGQIASELLRPLPYGIATLARWTGGSAYYLVMLAGVGLIAGWCLTGTIPFRPALAPGLVLSAVLGSGLILLFHLQLGYAASWLGSAAPPFWVWQKLTFVLGGLLMPLTFYPQPWRTIAELSPFASILYGPGSLAFDASLPRHAAVLGAQLIWLVLIGAVTVLVDRRAAARFLEHGV